MKTLLAPAVITICFIISLFSAFSFAATPGLYVNGRYLYDKCGSRIVLRGFNAMILYWDRPGTITYPEISKTGANCCRIFWGNANAGTAQELDQTVTNCWTSHLIPIPSIWDATGDWSKLTQCVDWWCSAAISAVVKKHEEHMIVNIANEAGDGAQSDADFRTAYTTAVTRLRAAGIHTPILIDASGWGRKESYIINSGRYLLDQDPDRNLLFAWHPYDPISWNGTQARIKAAIDSMVARNICCIVGEFAECENGSTATTCAAGPCEWRYIMKYAHTHDIGWMPWVWWCCTDPHDAHTISSDKLYGHWANAPWGEAVAISDTYSVKNTAQRTVFIDSGACRASKVAAPAVPCAPPKAAVLKSIAAYSISGRIVRGGMYARQGVYCVIRNGKIERLVINAP